MAPTSVILGGPGSGKVSHSRRISEEFGHIKHINVTLLNDGKLGK